MSHGTERYLRYMYICYKFLFYNSISFYSTYFYAGYKESFFCLKLSALDDRGIFPSHRKADARTHTSNPLLSSLSSNGRDECDERKREKENERKRASSLWRRELYRLVSSSFLSFYHHCEKDICERDSLRRSTFIYVRSIDSLLYG